VRHPIGDGGKDGPQFVLRVASRDVSHVERHRRSQFRAHLLQVGGPSLGGGKQDHAFRLQEGSQGDRRVGRGVGVFGPLSIRPDVRSRVVGRGPEKRKEDHVGLRKSSRSQPGGPATRPWRSRAIRREAGKGSPGRRSRERLRR